MAVAPIAFIGLLLLAVSHHASADLTVTGDWIVSANASYANETITILNVTGQDGNLTVMSPATLLLQNVTIILPFQANFVVQGQADVRNSTVEGEAWHLWLQSRTSFVDS